jgi:hypothetical protein
MLTFNAADEQRRQTIARTERNFDALRPTFDAVFPEAVVAAMRDSIRETLFVARVGEGFEVVAARMFA